jgi:hypothetical protein
LKSARFGLDLRVCSAECMFVLSYDYLYEIGSHRDFRNSLHKKENEQDAAERRKYLDKVCEEAQENLRKCLSENEFLLTNPAPSLIQEMFQANPMPVSASVWVKNPCGTGQGIIKIVRDYDMIESCRIVEVSPTKG